MPNNTAVLNNHVLCCAIMSESTMDASHSSLCNAAGYMTTITPLCCYYSQNSAAADVNARRRVHKHPNVVRMAAALCPSAVE
jgi:hypothetical protein